MSLLWRRPRAAAPTGTGTHAAEAIPAAAIQGAIGPELIEQTKSEAASRFARLPPCAPDRLNGRSAKFFTGDAGTPQLFQPHPNLNEIVAGNPITNALPTSTLPGRVPAIVWDGEPGANAPTMG